MFLHFFGEKSTTYGGLRNYQEECCRKTFYGKALFLIIAMSREIPLCLKIQSLWEDALFNYGFIRCVALLSTQTYLQTVHV
jgi:hypothetical protein